MRKKEKELHNYIGLERDTRQCLYMFHDICFKIIKLYNEINSYVKKILCDTYL